jgi:c-di-AMP phosphodiesterase-like protein
MIHVKKSLFYTLLICVICVVVTLCVSSIISGDVEGLISNVVLAITSIVGLFIKYDDEEHTKSDSEDNISESEFDDDIF